MANEPQPLDITSFPELVRLVEEVHRTQESRMLRRDSEDLAILMPAKPTKKQVSTARVARGRVLRKDDPLWRLIGIGRSGRKDISSNKHKYLAEAYLHGIKQV